ncbi:hypothetical protein CRG98_022845 [Punica granatum]|uniref:Uncharacterized protein n=1 Tax=Punica granatum TaxID=22663 RepID=A0A2I0JKJ7_PUNGR|nr:hypothetical protein CRG98_022845 [Punica granatum]
MQFPHRPIKSGEPAGARLSPDLKGAVEIEGTVGHRTRVEVGVIKAVHELPILTVHVRDLKVNEVEGAIGGGCEGDKVVGIALPEKRVVDERRREGESPRRLR